jgi:hypothetical protein
MIKKRLFIICFLVATFFSIGCVSSQQVLYYITSQPVTANDGSSIVAEEREMIRALVPFFVAITKKDARMIKAINPAARNMTDEQLLSNLDSVKSYTLAGVEGVTFDGEKLKAKIIYSSEIIEPGTGSRNVALFQSDVELIRERNTWVISEWNQVTGSSNDMEYFREIVTKMEQAEKRYGVKDLSTWNGL